MQKDDWMAPPDVLDLEPNQVDIWRVFIDPQTASVQLTESTLSAEETQRAERFHFDRDRHRFVIAHIAPGSFSRRCPRRRPYDPT